MQRREAWQRSAFQEVERCSTTERRSARRVRTIGPACHIPGLRWLLALAALSGIILAAQAPPRVILTGGGVTAAGLEIFIVRRGAWKTTLEAEAGLQREEKQFEVWLQERQHWLLRCTWRSRPPALSEQSRW